MVRILCCVAVFCARVTDAALVEPSSLHPVATAEKIDPSESIPEYLAKYGISVEQHYITTEDGYILGTFRLPHPGAPVLLLQHGILASAWCWFDNKPELSPGIQLYKAGYDVWLTNSRGNTYSRNHTSLQPVRDVAFWDYTFADMGRYDVPANINYILSVTGMPDLSFLGWSQGTTQFFVAMTDEKVKPLVDSKVNLFVAFSPVTFMQYQTSQLLSVVADLRLGQTLEDLFPYGFLNQKSLDKVANVLCKLTVGVLCSLTVDAIAGTSPFDTAAAITNMTAHFPAGTSVKSLNHYEQLMSSHDFRDYDYGEVVNLRVYHQSTPPVFDVSRVTVPTALFIGGEDTMADHKDVARLTLEMQNSSAPALVFQQEFPQFSHMTWYTGSEEAYGEYFPLVLNLLNKYNPLRVSV